MNDNPIGIIDSGVGGLSVWKEIVKQLPNESTIYLADSLNCPYGSRKEGEIYNLAKGLIEFLVKKRVKLIIVACNTITVSCIDKLRLDFPHVPMIGIVPVVKTAAEISKTKVIGVLSTETTGKSEYQKNLIKNFANGCQVINVGTNKLVPFVERGELEGEEVGRVVGSSLEKFVDTQIDAIALGCSHFPFLRHEMEKIMGNKVLILDSSGAIARHAQRVLSNNSSLSIGKSSTHIFYTTGDLKIFNAVYKKLLGDKYVHKVISTEKALINNWKKNKIAILGMGREGLSTLRFLSKKSKNITVLDKRKENEFDQEIIREIKKIGAKFILGSKYLDNLDFDVIVRAPGIKINLLQLKKAEEKGAIITSQIKIFFDECPCQIIGITGTKGKGTTSSLVYEILKKQGLEVYLGGNIGNAPLDFLNKLNEKSIVALELSSFQLQDLTKSPHIGVMLMTTSEHLDYHKDTYEYVEAKRNILRFQKKSDFAVVNRDYPASNESDILTEGTVYKVSKEREIANGCYVKDKKIWVNINGSIDEIIKAEDILLPGSHNLENICAAVMVAKILKVQNKNIVETLKTFRGLEHRLELAREVNGVKYYDDSFSTIPETAIAAIQSFKNPEILIMGGSSKGSDFTSLGEVISSSTNIKAIIGIGIEWPQIKSKIKNQNSKILLIEGVRDMKTIVIAANKIARPGDVVLLSPACASFDMFKNYKDRGEQFKKQVQNLK